MPDVQEEKEGAGAGEQEKSALGGRGRWRCSEFRCSAEQIPIVDWCCRKIMKTQYYEWVKTFSRNKS
jgi:hypothetical protein